MIQIDPEALASWYFRLNGFFLIPNFIVHPDFGSTQKTDIDVLGVRFPYRAELITKQMKDDEFVTSLSNSKILLVLVEVKTDRAAINKSWKDKDAKNMQRVLRATGLFPLDEEYINNISLNLYEKGFFESETIKITWICVGSRESIELQRQYPNVPIITFSEILGFIYDRFEQFRDIKTMNSQWDNIGKRLFENMLRGERSKKEYIDSFEIITNQEFKNRIERRRRETDKKKSH